MCGLVGEPRVSCLSTWLRSWHTGPRPGYRPIEGKGVASFLDTDVDKVSTSGENESVRVFVRSRTTPGNTQPF